MSKVASYRAVIQSASSRWALSAALTLAPGLSIYYLERRGIYQHKTLLGKSLQIAVMVMYMYWAIAFACSIYPQRAVINTDELEPQFHNRTYSDGA